MTRFAFCAVAALALTACGSDNEAVDADGDGAISNEEAEVAAARVRPLEPGEYKMMMELISIDDPSLSEQEIAQAKQFFGAMSEMAPPRCLTEEEAAKGMTGIAEGLQRGNCDTQSLTADENGMQGTMICQGQNGDARVEIDSTTTGTQSEMTMNVTEPAANGGEKNVVMKIGMTRTGDCTTAPAGE